MENETVLTLNQALRKMEEMEGFEIPEKWISEPTRGGKIIQVKLRTSESSPSVQYVDVYGIIRPVDRESFPIEWEILFPLCWNGRTLQLGGGANCGQIPKLNGNAVLGDEIPVDVGYVVYGDDSGHQSEDAMNAEFAANEEALQNYIRLHLIKTHCVMRHLVEMFYEKAARYHYFAGGSAGGREALECATKYGEYYDGIFCAAPVSNFVLTRLWGAILSRNVYKNYDPFTRSGSEGFISENIVEAIRQDAVRRYDKLDGIEDGVVSNIYAARSERSTFRREIQEKYGLSDVQMETLDIYEKGYKLEYDFPNGMNSYHGYSAMEGGKMDLGPDPVPREPLDTKYNVHHGDRSDGIFKYFIMKDPTWRLIEHDYFHPDKKLYEALMKASEQYDVNTPDFDRFLMHGGKLILFAGWNDMSISPWQTVQQYLGYVKKYGQEKVDSFCKFYIMPSVEHCVGARMKYLSWLDEWRTTGKYPEGPQKAYIQKTQGYMPMAEFPGWVKYREGDPKDSESYEISHEIPEGFFGRYD